MKHILFRALGISTLKNILFIILSVVGMLTLALKMNLVAFSALFFFIYAVNGFVFAEWIFKKGHRYVFSHVLITAVATFALDSFISIGFFSWVYKTNMFLQQAFWPNLFMFFIHLIVFLGAYFLRLRFSAMQSLSEGLES